MKSNSCIIGRQKEQEKLQKIVESKKSELLALYGRRRVGKTFLINPAVEAKVGCPFPHPDAGFTALLNGVIIICRIMACRTPSRSNIAERDHRVCFRRDEAASRGIWTATLHPGP